MLRALRRFAPGERAGILAAFTSRLLPDPGTASNQRSALLDEDTYEEMYKNILDELRIPVSQKDQYKQRILAYLTNEMRNLAIEDQTAEVRGRAGQKGLLNPSQYQITFTERYAALSERWISRNMVLNAIHHADSYQHLLADKFPDGEAASLFVKHGVVPHQRNASVLVFARRKNTTLTVYHAWILLHDRVNMHAVSPVDLLKHFLDVYGLNVRAGTHEAKFILYEEVAPEEGEVRFGTSIQGVPPGGELNSHCLVYPKRDAVAIAVAFAVHTSAYESDLVAHGIGLNPSVSKKANAVPTAR